MGVVDFQSGIQGELLRRAAAAFAQQKFDEEQRQALAREAAEQAQLGLTRQKIEQDASQFDSTMGLNRDKLTEDARQFDAGEPQRTAQTGYIRAQMGELARKPEAEAADRAHDIDLIGRREASEGRLITKRGAAQPSIATELAEYEAKKKIDAKYGGTRPSIGAEKNALNFFNRMLEAEKNARAVEDKLSPRDVAASEYAPAFLENWLKSPEGQAYTQAQRTFTEARLRKESGAAIPQGEYDTDRKTNFRVAGDKDLTQKRGSRLQLLRGLGTSAGRALQEFYGEGATLDNLLRDFAPAAAGGAVPMLAPDGRELMVPADKVADMEAAGAKRR